MNPAGRPLRDMLRGLMSIKRHERLWEIAAPLAWVARLEAGFVTGAMHTIDGGVAA
ncbi:hypothetical protein [Muricoccus vinaceus]|uniref:SDR family oxidoreductase n=1 Tax=Muricoccus vinaceus TaxID=424704 RepID=A0ABV6IVB5_9PROT